MNHLKANYIVISCVLFLLVSFLIVSCGREKPKTEETKTETPIVEVSAPTVTVEETVVEPTSETIPADAPNPVLTAIEELQTTVKSTQETITSFQKTQQDTPNPVLTAIEELQAASQSTLETIISFQKTQQDAPNPVLTAVEELQTTVKSSQESLQSTLKMVTSIQKAQQAETSTTRWREAHNKGVNLYNEKKYVEASYYLSNALGCSPGNFRTIDLYYKTMLALSKTENSDANTPYDLSVLQIMEGFLQSQIPLVEVAEVEKILALLKDVRGKMNAAETPIVLPDSKYDGLLKQIENDLYFVPKTGKELLATQEELQTLREYEAGQSRGNADTPTALKIDQLSGQVQASLEYLTLASLLDARKSLVKEACKTSATIAEYRLQECEQCLREMIAVHPAQYAEELSGELKSLKDLAMEVAEAKGNEIWNENKPILEKYKEDRDAIWSESDGKGQYQRKLENLQQEAMHLQNVLPLLTGSSLEDAVSRRNSLNAEAIRLSNEQSKAYNNWAMGKIKAGLQQAEKAQGSVQNWNENLRNISKALISHLGPIDRRYLTSEVSRCYDEVQGKYLAKLNPVNDENDLNKAETLLYTLNRMQETTKKQLSEF